MVSIGGRNEEGEKKEVMDGRPCTCGLEEVCFARTTGSIGQWHQTAGHGQRRLLAMVVSGRVEAEEAVCDGVDERQSTADGSRVVGHAV